MCSCTVGEAALAGRLGVDKPGQVKQCNTIDLSCRPDIDCNDTSCSDLLRQDKLALRPVLLACRPVDG